MENVKRIQKQTEKYNELPSVPRSRIAESKVSCTYNHAGYRQFLLSVGLIYIPINNDMRVPISPASTTAYVVSNWDFGQYNT